jgi:hypothetical protein
MQLAPFPGILPCSGEERTMRRFASCLGFALIVAWMGVPAFAADDAKFGAVSSDLSADASSVGFDISGRFDPVGGAVTVVEIPSYLDPQQGLVLMVSVIARAGSRLIDQCAVGADYPIEVQVNGSANRTTAGRCREFMKNPCAEGICEFWVAARAG